MYSMKKVSKSLFVDADSCPVKDEVITVSMEFDLNTIFVSSFAHDPSIKFSNIKYVLVDCGKEAVDLYLMNHVQKGDVVVTQDHALASILLAKKAIVVSPRGKQYDESNITFLLDMRYLNSKQRRAGNKTKGPKSFTNEDRLQFMRLLRKIFSKLEDFDE